MAKKIIQDIIVNKDPKGNRTSICVVSQIKETASKKIEEDKPIWISQKKRGEDVFSTTFASIPQGAENITPRSRKAMWIIAVVVCLVAVFLLSSLFSTAEIRVYPNSNSVELDDTLKISKDSENSSIPFEIVQVEKTVSKKVDPDSEQQSSIKAVGKAFIFNEYSTSKQRLIVNTRLETSDGLIYKIKQSVDVPGFKMEGDKKIPGKIEVEIIADEAGEKYNMKVSDLKGDFTIPGLKDSKSKYEGFYGRLSSDIKGGYIGLVKTVSDEKKETYKNELRSTLSTELIKEFSANVPKGYVYFENVKYIEYDNSVSGIVSMENELSEKATLRVFVFDEKKLASYIAVNKIEGYESGEVYPIFTNDVVVQLKAKTEKPWEEESLSLDIQGQVKIIKKVDEDRLKKFVVGMRKSTVGVLISSEFSDEIEKISINLRPQWNLSLPKKAENIKVRVVLE
jgi:hypothetical protein